MHSKIGFCLSILIFIAISSYLYIINQQDFNLSQESNPRETIELWASTPAVIELAKQYDAENPDIQVNTRYFDNQDFLLEEIYGAVSATTPPDIAEISSHYGIYPLIEADAIINLNEWLPSLLLEDIIPGIASRFEYNDSLWAWPIGSSLPIIYYNQSLLENHGIYSPNAIKTWEELWEVSTQLVEQRDGYKNPIWGFHTDLLTPWYLMTMLKQQMPYRAHSLKPEELTVELFAEWDHMVNDYQLMPPLTHQLAITQFVNGQGGFLLSSTESLTLIESLIAGKFDMGILPIPKGTPWGTKGYIGGGSGLVVFHSENNRERTLPFMEYISKKDHAIQLSRKTDYIPAQLSVLQSDQIQNDLRFKENYKTIFNEALEMEPYPLTKYDQIKWKTLHEIQEKIESKE